MAGSSHEGEDLRTFEIPDSDLPPLPTDDDEFLGDESAFGDSQVNSDGILLDKELNRKLMDVESSFLPELSPQNATSAAPVGVDDTYLFGGSPGHTRPRSRMSGRSHGEQDVSEISKMDSPSPEEHALPSSSSPATPEDAYKTPAPARIENEVDFQAGDTTHDDTEDTNTSSIDVPSSPTAAAAQRNLARTVSRDALNNRNGDEENYDAVDTADESKRKTKSPGSPRPTSRASTVKATVTPDDETSLLPSHDNPIQSVEEDTSTTDATASSLLRKRPSYLTNRLASQRSSTSSIANKSDYSADARSDATLGADFALQSGGAAPAVSSTRSSYGLSRLPSLGSIVSGYSDSGQSYDPRRSISGFQSLGGLQGDKTLERLEEQERENSMSPPPATPRKDGNTAQAPTDTVIAQHLKNIQVPDTIAKKYREERAKSPDKRSIGLPLGRSRNNLTLKEQNSKIDSLSKENFDLKLRIYYLDQALQAHSDEGVKEMIAKNVQLQTDLATEKKETQSLRRKVRELERKLKAHEEDKTNTKVSEQDEETGSNSSFRNAELEEEIIYLRECLQHSEVQIEKLREDGLAKEVEKRRLAEYVKSMSDRGVPEPVAGVEEAMEMWKDLLQAETARREQADEDAQKLREEIRRLKSETPSTTNHHVRNVYQISKRNHTSYTSRSLSGASDNTNDQNGRQSMQSGSTMTLVDQLKHENAELRRDLGAQTSMLTSRNRERERLQQEIEDLKLTQRRGDGRSIAGDSIFERSISRAHQRSVSRASGATGMTKNTQLSDAERDDYENKQATLRDELANAKLENQELEREFNAHLTVLDQTEADVRALKEERDLLMNDIQAIQTERDDILLSLEEKEAECENLKVKAETTIRQLDDELDKKDQDISQLVQELENRNEDFAALQDEMKNVSGSLIQLEDDLLAKQQKIQTLEAELDDANRELDTLDKRLSETTSKNERLEVQLESTQGEIAFLREEQEGDKIKIGDLEAELNTAQTNIQEEKERMKNMEEQNAEERRQREILDNKEKSEVQKTFNELNNQLTKSKDEVRKLRKSLSTKEVEATTWKQRLDELETNLREALGNLNGTRSSLLKDITKLQQDLDNTIHELDTTRNELVEKDRLLRNRDALLESTGLESRRLSDLLDKERQARKQERHHFEQAQRTHQTTTRTIQQHETRVLELETARSQDRRKLANLEQNYQNQLLDRNNLLLALWNRLMTLCGTDWAQKHSLVNGELISLDVISRNLAGFNKNIILAVKNVESLIGDFRARIRNIERDLWKEYQKLEHTLDIRVKRLDQLERAMPTKDGKRLTPSRIPSHTESAELMRLRSENKMLKAEIQFNKQLDPPPPPRTDSEEDFHPGIPHPSPPTKVKRASVANTLLRHHSTSAVEALQQGVAEREREVVPIQQIATQEATDRRWIHRLKELERRLKAEREARLLDRSGARKRLEEKELVNEELRLKLERERSRRESAEGGTG